MLEQIVRKQKTANDRFWKNVFEALQFTSIIILVFCAWFGLSANRYYWETDRILFFRACLSLLVIILPLAAFVLVMHRLIQKYTLEYDYELFENNMEISRVLSGSRRKRYLSFDLTKITYFRDISSIRPGSPDEMLLRTAKSASCNLDAPHLVLIQAECEYKRSTKTQYILLELNDVFYETLYKVLHTSHPDSRNGGNPYV